MHGLTDFITQTPWEDIALTLYVCVDDACQQVCPWQSPVRTRGPQPTMSDSEVITCTLLCELLFQGDEERFAHFLAHYMRPLFPVQLERSQFNRRRRALTWLIEGLRRFWRNRLLPQEETLRLIDSAPVSVCTYARSNRCQTVRGREYCGRIASKQAHFFGFRLHLTVTPDQLVDEWLLAPAGEHDLRVAEALLADEGQIAVIGDGAYNSEAFEQELWEEAMIQLLPMRRCNQQRQWLPETRHLLIRARMRVETAFSQLATVWRIEHVGARSLGGLVNRVASKILAHTFCFLWHRLYPACETHT
jgi:hypothetical protein